MLGWVAERLYCEAKGRAEGLLPRDSHAPSPEEVRGRAWETGDSPGRAPSHGLLRAWIARCFLRLSPDAHKASTGEAWAAPVPGSVGSSGGRRGSHTGGEDARDGTRPAGPGPVSREGDG